MTVEKEKILDALTIFLDSSSQTLLDGFDTPSIKKWRNRLVTLPAQIKAGKVKNPAEVERYINIALKSATINAKMEQQKNMLTLFAKLVSRLLSTFLLAQAEDLSVSLPANPTTNQSLTENNQKI